MSEDAPQADETQRLRDHAAESEGSFAKRVYEARADEAEAASAIGNVATQIPVAEAEDPRQDPIKAETVGRAAMESESQEVLDWNEEAGLGFGKDDEFDGTRAAKLHRAMTEPTEEDIRTWDGRASEVVAELSFLERKLQQAKEDSDEEEIIRLEKKVDEQKRWAKREAGKEYARYIPERKRKIESKLEPFEELYEMNPDRFAQMPTSEFIEVRKKLTAIETEIDRVETSLELLYKEANKIKDAMDNKSQLSWSGEAEDEVSIYPILEAVTNAVQALGQEVELDIYLDVDKKIEAQYESENDTWNRSGQQIMEGYQRLTNEYIDQLRMKMAEAERAKQEFMQKHGIKTTESEEDPRSPEQIADEQRLEDEKELDQQDADREEFSPKGEMYNS